ncbi:hypothetical protein [Vibrio phage S4-7]|nr:hypothetical protein [Vibrio phage S4-7]
MEVECKSCNQVKNIEFYYLDKRSKNNKVRQPCKECMKAKEKAKRETYNSQEKCIPESKVCSCCEEEKPSSEFHKRKDTPTGLRDKCKECYNKNTKERRLNGLGG